MVSCLDDAVVGIVSGTSWSGESDALVMKIGVLVCLW